jgi:hypothetical protein
MNCQWPFESDSRGFASWNETLQTVVLLVSSPPDAPALRVCLSLLLVQLKLCTLAAIIGGAARPDNPCKP